MTMLGSSAGVVVQMDDKSSSSCLTQSRRGLPGLTLGDRGSASTRGRKKNLYCEHNLCPLGHFNATDIVVQCKTAALACLLVKEKRQFALFNLKNQFATCPFLQTNLLPLTSSLLAVNLFFI